jgi:DmsE family decaheme c-type cytochrome
MNARTTISPRAVAPSAALAMLVLAGLAAGLAGCNRRMPGGRSNDSAAPYGYKAEPQFRTAQLAELRVPVPEIAEAEYVNDDQICATCHETYVKTFQSNVHRGESCEKCHGPASRHLVTRGREPGTILSFKKLDPPQRSELCIKCHEQDSCAPGKEWRTSTHAHNGVSCTDCHTSHYNVPPGTPATQVGGDAAAAHHKLTSLQQEQPPPSQEAIRAQSRHMGAITPHVCYRCHANKAQQEDVAHPHQICGAAGFDCATCHNPHGKIRPETRTDLCLQCHNTSSPAMAWHSSIHAQYGVACADCHNPHPNLNVQQLVNIQHTNIRRPPRMPMSVDEPTVCYKCHGDIYGKTSMPQHHPIKEGKMVCSDCHDGHGQTEDNLREPTVNMVCYRCHAEKQGPFAYEHPPVTENCDICHEPHGTVANNLLRQPTTFLCLRCHSGHRTSPLGPNHTGLLGDVGTNPNLQRAFFTDCTQCHSQIHGSDVPTPHLPHAFMR